MKLWYKLMFSVGALLVILGLIWIIGGFGLNPIIGLVFEILSGFWMMTYAMSKKEREKRK